MSEFPKLLWGRHGDEIVVGSAQEEAARRADGYFSIAGRGSPPPAEAPDPIREEAPEPATRPAHKSRVVKVQKPPAKRRR